MVVLRATDITRLLVDSLVLTEEFPANNVNESSNICMLKFQAILVRCATVRVLG
jgi:hypothetical protein